MIDISKIKETLVRMIPLLQDGGAAQWAVGLEGFHDRIDQDPQGTVSDILSIFGGMGSLNDIVLYRGGLVLAEENTEFDLLRSKLYNFCHE